MLLLKIPGIPDRGRYGIRRVPYCVDLMNTHARSARQQLRMCKESAYPVACLVACGRHFDMRLRGSAWLTGRALG